MTKVISAEGLSSLQSLPQRSYFKTTLTRRWGKVHRVWPKLLVLVELAGYGSADYAASPFELPEADFQLLAVHPGCKVEACPEQERLI